MDVPMEAQSDEDVIPEDNDVCEIIEMTDDMMLDSLPSNNEDTASSSRDDEVPSRECSCTSGEGAYFLQDKSAQNEDALYLFCNHRQDKKIAVTCCALSKNGQLVAIGTSDNEVFLWNVFTEEIIMECSDFNDGVLFVRFNYNNMYLATADRSGRIKAWQIDNKTCVMEYKLVVCSAMVWHISDNVLLVSLASDLFMFELPHGNLRLFQEYGDTAETFAILPDGRRAAVAFSSGLIHVIDLRTETVLCSTPRDPKGLRGHQYSVGAIDCHPTVDMLISGSASGQVILSSSKTGKIISLLYDPKLLARAGEEEKIAVDAVAFSRSPSLDVAAVALTHNVSSSHGILLIWDIWNMRFTLRHELEKLRISKIAWTSTDVLFAASIDGVLRSYDARAGKCLRVFRGHVDKIIDLQICEKEKKALTVSADSTARIFDISSVLT